MAKVYAVTNENNELQLKVWKSASVFMQEGNSWVDDRFIYLASSDDFKKGLYREMHINPQKGHFGVVLDDEHLAAYKMMHEAHVSYMKGKKYNPEGYSGY